MSFSLKKFFLIALLSIFISSSLVVTYLSYHSEQISLKVSDSLNKSFTQLKKDVLLIQEVHNHSQDLNKLVTLILASRSLRSVAYIQDDHYVYSDRQLHLNQEISPSLQQKIKTEPFPFLYRKQSSLNNIEELHFVIKGKNGFYQLFLNARYMDDWLDNADLTLNGYVVNNHNQPIINQPQKLLIKAVYQSSQYPFKVVIGEPTQDVIMLIAMGAAFIFAFILLGLLFAKHLYNNNFSFRVDIERAIRAKEFIAYYQPIVSNKSLQCSGAELLCRWHHKKKRILAPSYFITKVEESGQIKAITLQLLNQLAKDKIQLCKDNPDFYISINFTLAMLRDEAYMAEVVALIKKNTSLQSGLVFELTERENTTCAMKELNTVMTQFRQIGVRWALDDFGTGYSSLSSVRSLNFDIIKIDKLFVLTADTDAITSSILKNIAYLGKGLNCKMVAEGVETQTQFNKLLGLNIDYSQGYLFSKPMPIKDFLLFQHSFDHRAHICQQPNIEHNYQPAVVE
ncbi:EAL domain-containing protein [Photobacterium damselae]|uniref:EAL domain-containing protein n=1 Tax=Photobacterium damselae TaxID=38293 RepID=UPI0040686B3E